jgi:hypothetical protein
MTVLLKVLLTFNATSLLLIIYWVKSVIISSVARDWWMYIAPVAMLAVPIVLTAISIRLARRLSSDSFPAGSIESVSHASNIFLPSYLGYFFVALSVPNVPTLLFVYMLLALFTFFSQALYFNPLFLLFGYNFYNVRTRDGVEAFLISRQKLRSPGKAQVLKARRINGFTFLEGK